MKPSIILDLKRGAIHDAVARFHTTNPRIFGSVLHRTDCEDSDLDLLVDALPGATLFDLGGLQIELGALLGIDVQVVTPAICHRNSALRYSPKRSRYDSSESFYRKMRKAFLITLAGSTCIRFSHQSK